MFLHLNHRFKEESLERESPESSILPFVMMSVMQTFLSLVLEKSHMWCILSAKTVGLLEWKVYCNLYTAVYLQLQYTLYFTTVYFHSAYYILPFVMMSVMQTFLSLVLENCVCGVY